MSIATVGTGIAVAAGVGAAGSIAGGLIGASGASGAAKTQAQAADQAAQLQFEEAQQALQFQEAEFAQQQADIAPWLNTGGSAALTLGSLMGLPGYSTPQVGLPGLTAANPNAAMPLSSVIPGFTPQGAQTSVPTQGAPPMSSAQAEGLVPQSALNRAVPFQSQTLRQLVDSNGGGINSVGGPGGPPIAPGQFSTNGSPTPGPVQANGNPAQLTVPVLGSGAGTFGSYLQPFTQWNTPFEAPTAAQAAATPGEQFELGQGLEALDRGAAARGTLTTGGTGKAEQIFGQGLASTNYQQAYNNALTQYQQAYNIFQNNQNTQFNRLAALSGFGQTATGQLNSAGGNAANNFSNILLGSGAQIGNAVQAAAAARASGQVGSANAISGGLGGVTSFASLLPFLLNNQNSGVPSFDPAGTILGQDPVTA
jgi:hypothetical protein